MFEYFTLSDFEMNMYLKFNKKNTGMDLAFVVGTLNLSDGDHDET